MTEPAPSSTPTREEFTLPGNQVAKKVQELVAKGNVRSVVVKHNGRVVVEFPLTIGVVGTVLAPQIAVIGVLAALLNQCSIEVVHREGIGT